MDLQITHPCPSCGGPVNMAEMDRLTTCGFCDVQNYMVATSLLRYVLPDRIPERIPRKEIIYFPYLRFKGNIFSCQGQRLDYKILDTTYQGLFTQGIPPSLGLRPQAMPLSAANAGHLGKFVRRKEAAMTIMQRAAKMAGRVAGGSDAPFYHRAFIGEIISCIYLPLYVEQGQVYDGILNRSLGKAQGWLTDGTMTVPYHPNWTPRFIASLCPECGAAMEGSPDSQILHCFNCHCCCVEKNGRFVAIPYSVVRPKNNKSVLLPFWKLEVRGAGIHSLADFLKITNQPVAVTSRHEQCAMAFWIPAFKIRPKAFLQLAKSATLLQMPFPEGKQELCKSLFPVTLPVKEAAQAMKSVLAATTMNKKDLLPQLPSVTFSLQRKKLVFLPFTDNGHDLVQQHSAFSVASSIVHFGRKL